MEFLSLVSVKMLLPANFCLKPNIINCYFYKTQGNTHGNIYEYCKPIVLIINYYHFY